MVRVYQTLIEARSNLYSCERWVDAFVYPREEGRCADAEVAERSHWIAGAPDAAWILAGSSGCVCSTMSLRATCSVASTTDVHPVAL